MSDPVIAIRDTLNGVTELMEKVAESRECLHCLELEVELQTAYDEIDGLEGLLADMGDE